MGEWCDKKQTLPSKLWMYDCLMLTSSLFGTGAKVRDLWRKKDLGTMTAITAQLTGDGDSSMFRLSKA